MLIQLHSEPKAILINFLQGVSGSGGGTTCAAYVFLSGQDRCSSFKQQCNEAPHVNVKSDSTET